MLPIIEHQVYTWPWLHPARGPDLHPGRVNGSGPVGHVNEQKKKRQKSENCDT